VSLLIVAKIGIIQTGKIFIHPYSNIRDVTFSIDRNRNEYIRRSEVNKFGAKNAQIVFSAFCFSK